MILWLVLGLMTAAAVFAVLWPLARAAKPKASGTDLAVYQDQLSEIERDQASGRIGAAEAEAARIEVSRRLLGAADQPDNADHMVSPAAATRHRRITAVVALVLLPLGGLSLYLVLGSPDLPGEPLAARMRKPPEHQSVAALVAQVEAHLARDPSDGRGWEVLAPIYLQMGRVDNAVAARRNALRLLGATAAREANLGEALIVASNGIVTEEAKAAFERALKLDQNDERAQFFTGLAAEQEGKREQAAAIWRALLAKAPPGAAWIGFVRQALARVDDRAPLPAGEARPAPPMAGPSEQDMAAAADMTPQQRGEMIRGMVDRLAERLKQDGSDLDGWLRLVRSYAVLGDRDKARAAAAEARRALAPEPEKVRRIDELVKGLGLEG
jgi:cytochrome c-type biogenesis protein CcmH